MDVVGTRTGPMQAPSTGQDLFLDLTPFPQVTEQLLQSPQAVHTGTDARYKALFSRDLRDIQLRVDRQYIVWIEQRLHHHMKPYTD